MGKRLSASQRGYDARWRKAREVFLAEHPFCVMCAQVDRVTAADTVDHIVRHAGPQDPLFWDLDNWQALCTPCHVGPKQASDVTGTLRGCDEDGTPLDPCHRWRWPTDEIRQDSVYDRTPLDRWRGGGVGSSGSDRQGISTGASRAQARFEISGDFEQEGGL